MRPELLKLVDKILQNPNHWNFGQLKGDKLECLYRRHSIYQGYILVVSSFNKITKDK